MSINIVYTTGLDGSYSESIGTDFSVKVETDTSRIVDYIEISPENDKVSFKIEGLSAEYIETQFPDDYQLDFTLKATDSDLDSDSASFSIAVNTTDTSIDISRDVCSEKYYSAQKDGKTDPWQ